MWWWLSWWWSGPLPLWAPSYQLACKQLQKPLLAIHPLKVQFGWFVGQHNNTLYQRHQLLWFTAYHRPTKCQVACPCLPSTLSKYHPLTIWLTCWQPQQFCYDLLHIANKVSSGMPLLAIHPLKVPSTYNLVDLLATTTTLYGIRGITSCLLWFTAYRKCQVAWHVECTVSQ